jgi:peptide/nickel transport system permease protein
MAGFLIRRLLLALLIVFMVSVFAFSLMHILPGDPVRIALGNEVSQEVIDKYRALLNLDKPLLTQYWLWIKGIFHGDFGTSILYNENVGALMKEKLPVTLTIGIPAVLLSVILGVLLGIITAVKRGSWIDEGLSFLANLGLGTPLFWIAILGIYLFGFQLRILPIQGYVSPFADFAQYLYKAIMPVVCMSIGFIAVIARQTRSNMLEVINLDFVRTARANGLPESSVIFRHALKNALIPVITIIGLQARIIVGGSVIIERVFNIPGIGSLLMRAITNRDYLIVQACVLVISLVTVGLNLIVDLAYGMVDPRVRKSWR